ncbi:hypothetical protein BDW59DRAFT_66021 [Aspergillus cavernicola]|uniref:SH2 domain-containing protein n=1 Tax=Aspergillus cavernicola TaxID=176166 RepID=A0ABR4H6A4_9EURO
MESKKWINEVNGGSLAITSCVGLLVSKNADDGFFIVRLGNKESFRIARQLCFGIQPRTTYT